MSVDATTLAAAILQQNNQAFGPVNRVVTDVIKRGTLTVYADYMADPTKGVCINKISAATAAQLAAIFIAQAATHPDVPLSYALACADIESNFDPDAYNGNFLGSNPEHGLDGYDLGCCQLKAKYLLSKEITTIAQAVRFALDPTQAIPYFFDKYSGLIAVATAFQKKACSTWNPKASNIFWTATAFYNFGVTGGSQMILAGDAISHSDDVGDLERWFAGKLGVASVMPEGT